MVKSARQLWSGTETITLSPRKAQEEESALKMDVQKLNE